MHSSYSEAQTCQSSLSVLQRRPQTMRGCASVLLLFHQRRGMHRSTQERQRPWNASESGEYGVYVALDPGCCLMRGCASVLLLFHQRRGMHRSTQERQRPWNASESGEYGVYVALDPGCCLM